jgi:Protein of unknown function (DUF2384)
MARLPTPRVGIPAQPSPGEALAALRRIMGTWELDRFDAAALVGSTTADITTIEWTEDRLLRAAYLIELETALLGLNPKARIARWIATPNPGPYFGGNAPLELLKVGAHEMQALLHQIRRWTSRRS